MANSILWLICSSDRRKCWRLDIRVEVAEARPPPGLLTVGQELYLGIASHRALWDLVCSRTSALSALLRGDRFPQETFREPHCITRLSAKGLMGYPFQFNNHQNAGGFQPYASTTKDHQAVLTRSRAGGSALVRQN